MQPRPLFLEAVGKILPVINYQETQTPAGVYLRFSCSYLILIGMLELQRRLEIRPAALEICSKPLKLEVRAYIPKADIKGGYWVEPSPDELWDSTWELALEG